MGNLLSDLFLVHKNVFSLGENCKFELCTYFFANRKSKTFSKIFSNFVCFFKKKFTKLLKRFSKFLKKFFS